jgi:hypothetical protein
VAAHESVNNFFTLARDADMLCFQP